MDLSTGEHAYSLVSIQNPEENRFVANLKVTGIRWQAWIGLEKKAYENWTNIEVGDWLDKTTSSYRNWKENEPTNLNKDSVSGIIA